MRIDLHTHSVASDGTDEPAQLVAAAAAAGLDVVALTDHDSTIGWAQAERAVPVHGVALVRGAEISCRTGGISVHVLSYLHDPDDAGLLAESERTRAARLTRAREMVERLAVDYALTWDDVVAQTAAGTTVGRPHIADALVERGYVADRSTAFGTLLGVRSRYYVEHHAPQAVRAVELIRAAGGVPVMAHPGAARGRLVHDRVIAEMTDAGLAGLEVHHRDHDPAQRARLLDVAASLRLLVTGSSDYHGAGKPNVLGENTTTVEVLEAIEAQGRLPLVRP